MNNQDQSASTLTDRPRDTQGCSSPSTGSALWAQFACAALVGEMTTISLHDKPQIWRPMQAENAAALADAMMVEHAKRFPQ